MDYPTSRYVFFVCLRAFKMFSTENETRVPRSFDFDITRTTLDESARPEVQLPLYINCIICNIKIDVFKLHYEEIFFNFQKLNGRSILENLKWGSIWIRVKF